MTRTVGSTIDYERMRKVWPRQKAALIRAVKMGHVGRIKDVCKAAVAEWNEIGAWPDDWAYFQRALDDALPWNEQIRLEEL